MTSQREIQDLCLLPSISDSDIVALIRERFQRDVIYTSIGDAAIVAVNPYKNGSAIGSSNDELMQAYVDDYRNLSSPRPVLAPHVYQLATHAYMHMRRSGFYQAIILNGESGSGKTESFKRILRQLSALSAHHKKSNKVSEQILHSTTVLESLGSAVTLQNLNASRFGRFMEIQFNARGRMIGAKTLDYMLEKSRVVQVAEHERNFNIFYYLLAGASADETTHLHLEGPENFRYTNMGRVVQTPGIDDALGYVKTKEAMRSLGLRSRQIAHIYRVLAAILHLGNIHFIDSTAQDEPATVKNMDILEFVADLLGVEVNALQNVLTYKTKLLNKDIISMVLDAQQATNQCDELARGLYSLLFAWVVEFLNSKLCQENFDNFIGVLDFPGFQNRLRNRFEQFCFNFANERIQNLVLKSVFDISECTEDGVMLPEITWPDNSECVELIAEGLIPLMTEHTRQQTSDDRMVISFDNAHNNHSSYSPSTLPAPAARTFGIRHFNGTVTYDPAGFLERNMDALDADFVSLFRGDAERPPSGNSFVVDLFRGKAITTQAHPRSGTSIVRAQQSSLPTRAPSTRHAKKPPVEVDSGELVKKHSGERSDSPLEGTATQLKVVTDKLVETLSEATLWYVFCIRSNDASQSASFDSKRVHAQVRAFGLSPIAQRFQSRYRISLEHEEFLERYADVLDPVTLEEGRNPKTKCEALRSIFGWTAQEMGIGGTKVFLSGNAWLDLEDNLRNLEKERKNRLDADSMYRGTSVAGSSMPGSAEEPSLYSGGNDARSQISENDQSQIDAESFYASEHYAASSAQDMYELHRMLPHKAETHMEMEEVTETSAGRKYWLSIVWLLTWPFPDRCLSMFGKRRPDVQMAWREKLALVILILLLMTVQLFFIVGLDKITCPKQYVFSPVELAAHSDPNNAYTAIRGEVFFLTDFAPNHIASSVIPRQSVMSFAGQDATTIFPVQVSALCDGINEKIHPSVVLQPENTTNPFTAFHDFRAINDDFRPDWYWIQMERLRASYRLGYMGYTMQMIRDGARSALSGNRRWAVIDDSVYDLTDYLGGGVKIMPISSKLQIVDPKPQATSADTNFIDPTVVALFREKAGQDITQEWRALTLDPKVKQRQFVCLQNLFFVGKVDKRQNAGCLFGAYLLLGISALMASVILFKFLAALPLDGRYSGDPMTWPGQDRFVIMQVPCYTEGDESLRRTIDSLAVLKYDDKRKLLFIICDGMIIGSGNDRPTPHIVLDILGVDPSVDPEPLSFISLGEGAKRHNMGKVYAGLYEKSGHVVPFVVVVKVGRPSERQRPGNRGKRDSQMILMRFLNKVHYDRPMAPLELELYHQMKNVIGVDPIHYEFVLMVDADTEVTPDSVPRLMAEFEEEEEVIGLCGETSLANERQSWVTMIQVYEYYISHHLSKAFESLFGSVTCLPGCFCMYRLRTPDTKPEPLLISDEVIEDYGENMVDTLHKKNLLHLGEDRYLTTLMIKWFPKMKLRFVPDARCRTNAPERWSVLLSQRRRWINSTVHNLAELVFLRHLCGICCFSMRFVVLMDLFATLVMPATVVYLIYLIYITATSHALIPWASIIMLIAVYGLQAVIFILRRKWEHVGWMIFYIIGLPFFSFYIPLYAFWHFDDFSWGNTRVVVGEKGKRYMVTDEGKFDPRMVPLKRWSEYEQELWETGTHVSHETGISLLSSLSKRRPQERGGNNRSSRAKPHHVARNVAQSITGDARSIYSERSAYSARDSIVSSRRPQSLAESRRYERNIPRVPQHFSRETASVYSQNLSHVIPPGIEPEAPNEGEALPTDEEILAVIRMLLSNADLTQLTKKQVREQLAAHFGVEMSSKKSYINNCIELILQGEL
ncbi:uncharacterized protein VTP21DRAFT_5225 [Calcarisporiella thermophila]|uniref:uncharacterized protein n=1 Tax=Calcarisporiella thermophila TaxID=911321 RepID=UPI0037428C31